MPKHRFTITFETDYPESAYPKDLTAEGKLALDIEELSEDYEMLEAALCNSDFVITGEVVNEES